MEPQEEQELHSFPYQASIGGKEHFYRITQQQEKYGIEQDGVVIAEVAHGDRWQQLSGEPLGKELLESICDHIEAHFG
ncbi:MAG TPA: hypothetical protein VK668_07015 [Mucilaginibacter sp.]|nr:hypothetical protein [Mucilaginibacter sp.]